MNSFKKQILDYLVAFYQFTKFDTKMAGKISELLWETNQNQFIDILAKYKQKIENRRRNGVVKFRRENPNFRKPRQKVPMARKFYMAEQQAHPGLSSVVEFRTAVGRGRCGFARRPVEPCLKIGAIKAFATVVDNTYHPYCLTCFKVKQKFIYCGECRNVVFCDNKKCQKKNTTHEYECGTSFHDIKFDEDIAIKCAIQMVFHSLATYRRHDGRDRVNDLIKAVRRLLNNRNEFDHPVPARTNTAKLRFRCIMQLHGMANGVHLQRSTDEAFRIIMQYPKIKLAFTNAKQRQFLQHLLMQFLMVLKENSFATALTTELKIPTCAIFDIMSLFNHSCAPNLINIYEDNAMHLISCRRIAADEELCISYCTFTTENTAERRKILKDTWNFICTCERCQYADRNAGNNAQQQRVDEQNEDEQIEDEQQNTNDASASHSNSENESISDVNDPQPELQSVPHPEITIEDINGVRITRRNKDDQFRSFEKNLKKHFTQNRSWRPKAGAYGIVYKEECYNRT